MYTVNKTKGPVQPSRVRWHVYKTSSPLRCTCCRDGAQGWAWGATRALSSWASAPQRRPTTLPAGRLAWRGQLRPRVEAGEPDPPWLVEGGAEGPYPRWAWKGIIIVVSVVLMDGTQFLNIFVWTFHGQDMVEAHRSVGWKESGIGVRHRRRAGRNRTWGRYKAHIAAYTRLLYLECLLCDANVCVESRFLMIFNGNVIMH